MSELVVGARVRINEQYIPTRPRAPRGEGIVLAVEASHVAGHPIAKVQWDNSVKRHWAHHLVAVVYVIDEEPLPT